MISIKGIFSFYLVSSCVSLGNSNIAIVSDKIADLVHVEGRLFSFLFKTLFRVKPEEECLFHIKKYLTGYREDKKTIKETMDQNPLTDYVSVVADNPLLTMRMIRRLVYLFSNATLDCTTETDENIIGDMEYIFEEEDISKPTQEDLYEVIDGILILQFIYGLNATVELQTGYFKADGLDMAIETDVILSLEDIYELAKRALHFDWLVLAYQWTEALQQLVDWHDEPTFWHDDDMALLENLWEHLAYKVNLNSIEEIRQALRGKRQEGLEREASYNTHAPCRGQSLLPPNVQRTLYCSYDHASDPYLILNPLKIEIISKDPYIVQYYDFVTKSFLQQASDLELDRNSTLDEIDFSDINRNTELLTGLKVHKLETGVYGPSGNFFEIESLHRDYVLYDKEKMGKQPVATALLILNEATLGGNYVFPNIGTLAEPVLGSALLFNIKNAKGIVDERIHYETCPILLGRKIVAGQTLSFPQGKRS